MADILYRGGACDGKHGVYDDSQAGAGITSCGGTVYKVWLLNDASYLGLLPGANPPNPAADQPHTDTYQPVDALLAWQVFARKVGRNLPGYVNTTIRLRRAIRQQGRL